MKSLNIALGFVISVGILFGGLFLLYLFFGFVDWLVGDPLDIIHNCFGCI